MKLGSVFVALLLLFAIPLRAADWSAEDLDRRRKALSDLVDEHSEYTLREQAVQFFHDQSATRSQALTVRRCERDCASASGPF